MAEGTVLIVDDDAYLRDSLHALISKWGVDSEEVCSGEEALLRLKKKEYSLVLLDMKMEDKDGLDVLDELRRRKLEVPVIMMTAYPHEERMQRVLQHKISLCLVKPINPGGLKKAMEHFLGELKK